MRALPITGEYPADWKSISDRTWAEARQPMRTAVLLSGEMRSADRCIESIRRHLFPFLGTDFAVFAHVADDPDARKVQLFSPLRLRIQAQPHLDEANYVHRSGRGVYGIQPVLRQLWSLQESMALVLESPVWREYTHAVRLRPDTFFLSDVEPIDTWRVGVHVPTFFNFWGLNDRFAFGDFGSMVAYHDRFDQLGEQMARGCIFQPETMLREHLEHHQVPVHRTAVLFDTIRGEQDGKPGPRVHPEWNRGADYGDLPPWTTK